MYLVIDCETTGLPKDREAPLSDFANWPRIIQIAWALYDRTGQHVESKICLIQPDNFAIPVDAQRVHRITTARALAEGEKLKTVLGELSAAVMKSEILIAHNLKFDESVISAEYLRMNIRPPFANKKRICTMEKTTGLCRIKGPHGYKWPSLSQLHLALFGCGYQEAHDAGADLTACAKCFFELRRRGFISL